MKVPAFKHTVARISGALEDERQHLQAICSLVKYDPGLFLSFLLNCPSRHGDSNVTTSCQAASLMGSNAIKALIAAHQHRLDDNDSLTLWHTAVLAGEAAVRINERKPVAEPEEAFFAATIPYVGMLLMLEANQDYKKLVHMLVKLSIEDRVFLEDRIFNINHIAIFDGAKQLPLKYRDVIRLIRMERFPNQLRTAQPDTGPRFSLEYEAAQLYRLSMSAESIAQSIFFPFIVLAEENFKRINKRFFQISENEAEELLTDIIDSYEAVCLDFGLEKGSTDLINEAIQYTVPESKFLTVSAPLLRVLNKLFAERHVENHIVIWGEAGVGKRLLAKALHYHPANSRRMKPFLAFHCDTIERETLEEELLGAKGGYWGHGQHKGAFDIADGGTIMLKDIDKMPLPLQERLAEVISKIDYYRVRKIPSKNPNVIFIATSRMNLEEEANSGRFSKMLLRALKPVNINIPPLRERRDDIGLIADGIIKKYRLPLQETSSLLGLQELYDADTFAENLSDLKRVLFYTAAKKILKP